MSDETHEKRRAFEAAGAHYRAFYERYYPVPTLGGPVAKPVTADALAEIERLKAAWDAAGAAWKASLRP